MKKLNSLLVSCVIIFITSSLFSCNSNDDIMNLEPTSTSPQTKSVQRCETRAQANAILVKYLELAGDTYILDISQAAAEMIGIPAELYLRAQEEIATTNKFISDLKNDSNSNLTLTDPQVALSQSAWIQPRDYVDELKGTLTTEGQEEAIGPFVWAPIGTKCIDFLCRSNAALTPVFTCSTYSSGRWRRENVVGALGVNTRLQVPIYVSNDSVRASFRTSDSNGGGTLYRGYK